MTPHHFGRRLQALSIEISAMVASHRILGVRPGKNLKKIGEISCFPEALVIGNLVVIFEKITFRFYEVLGTLGKFGDFTTAQSMGALLNTQSDLHGSSQTDSATAIPSRFGRWLDETLLLPVSVWVQDENLLSTSTLMGC